MSIHPLSTLCPLGWCVALGLASTAWAQGTPPPAMATDGEKDEAKGGMQGDASHCCETAPRVSETEPLTDRKAKLLRDTALKIMRSQAPFFGEQSLVNVDRSLSTLGEGAGAEQEIRLRSKRADLLMQWGKYEEAIDDLERVIKLAEGFFDERSIRQAQKMMALAWLRIGEVSNCVSNHNKDSCLFPLKDGAIHLDRKGSEKAIEILLKLLDRNPRDYSSMWLLNVAAMTVSKYPDGVPERFRIPPERLKSEHELPRMPEHSVDQIGVTGRNRAGGSIIDDFDNDGRLDLVLSCMDLLTPLRMYLQREDGSFEEVSKKVGLANQIGGLQLFHFDANNDGRLDLLVQRGAWMGPSGEIANSLLIQQEDGTFLDRTLEAGIEIAAPSQAAAFADVDHDGDVDLFLGYEGSGERYPSKLFKNKGDGTFEDVTKAVGIRAAGFVKGCAFGDYDRDGFPDLYVSTMNGANHLYRNEGGVKFVDVAAKLKVEYPTDSFASWFFDYDNDGWLDIYATGYPNCDRVGAMGQYWVHGDVKCETNKIYRNKGDGTFEDVTAKLAMERVDLPMGCAFGDVDNDGWKDFYLATGAPDYSTLFPNTFYRNDGGRKFQDITTTTGTGLLQKGHGVSFGDLDGDGDQDLFVEMGGAYSDDTFVNSYFVNPGHGNHWLTVRTRGTTSNRFGMGARIRVRIAEGGVERDVTADVGTNSSFGGNSLQEEMGLGKAEKITLLEVEWPTSKTKQEWKDVPLDSILVVTEGKAEFERVAPPAKTAKAQ